MAKSLLWSPLEAGDCVDIVAPGYRSTDTELDAGLEFLRGWSLVPRVPRQVYGRDVVCSNSDDLRFEFLKAAIYAPDSKAIWCIRGGYGSNRLLPRLMKLKRPKGPPKLLVGLSDITSLHVFLNQQWGWPTVHGPLLDRLGRKAALPKYERELRRFVFGVDREINFARLKPMNDLARERREIRAPVTGGNLIVLQSTLATPCEWQTKGQILFFEDIGERGYRLDRVLEQFIQAGMIAKARAVIFGQFTGGKEPDGSSLIWPVLKRFAERAPVPVLKGLASGHDVIQRPLPFGTRSVLSLKGETADLLCAAGSSR